MPADEVTSHGFCRVAAAVPRVVIADPAANAGLTADLAERAEREGASVVVFPELGLTGYSNDDLFQQRALLDAARDALASIVARSADWSCVVILGVPLVVDARLFNTAAVVHRGQILGVVPKSFLPNYREFYEKRQFSAAREAIRRTVVLGGREVPFGTDLLFESTDLPGLTVHVEICEDLWVPIPPSTYGAMAGATVLVNLSASNVTVAKADYRRELAASQSGRTISAYVYAAAGAGESTTDLAWDGHACVYENGRCLAESRRFERVDQLITADVDLERLADDRMRMTSYGDAIADHRDSLAFRRIAFTGEPAAGRRLQRDIERFPFVPAAPERRDERCAEAYRIQVQGLVTRLAATGIERVVIGVSGGLDSTHALLVACQAMDELGRPRTGVLAYTMPGFATSRTTKTNAWRLMDALGVRAAELDIRPSANQMLADIGHPAAQGEPVHDITYENVQAGERTSHLFRLANRHNGLVLGTGDLSELALGWSTYGVGDQMSHYNVNSSVPKTLMQFLVRWVAATDRFGDETSAVLREIVETEISPELVPAAAAEGGDGRDDDAIGQRTEDLIGPYALHDFFLYYTARYGFRPTKVAFLAHHAWHDPAAGFWPDLIPGHRRNGYELDEIVRWLRVFLQRFFATSQFKRSAMPNGPKIGSGGSLSPRGDWRAPSDSAATTWLAELDRAHPRGES
jgi:NAD+ synthase (glutamine-hydrolysing)